MKWSGRFLPRWCVASRVADNRAIVGSLLSRLFPELIMHQLFQRDRPVRRKFFQDLAGRRLQLELSLTSNDGAILRF